MSRVPGARARGEGEQVVGEVHAKALFVMSNGTFSRQVPAPCKDSHAQDLARALGSQLGSALHVGNVSRVPCRGSAASCPL